MPHRVQIRAERPDDILAIEQLTIEAFLAAPHSDHTEQHIIRALRAAGALSVSLVAEIDNRIAGHIAFSPVTLADNSPRWFGLGPMAVIPELQGQGIGTTLVTAGLAELQRLDAAGCLVVGEPGFYGRFGFSPDHDCTLAGIPAEYFQVLAWSQQAASGNVAYHAAFGLQDYNQIKS